MRIGAPPIARVRSASHEGPGWGALSGSGAPVRRSGRSNVCAGIYSREHVRAARALQFVTDCRA
eukprot:5316538-Pyramimonas_sp.AAC.1